MRIYALIAVGVILLGLLIAAVIVHRKTKVPPNYRAFFIIGITWLPLGIIMENITFVAMAAVFLSVSLINKKKWQTPLPWNELPPQLRRLKIVVMITLTVVLLAGLVLMYVVQR